MEFRAHSSPPARSRRGRALPARWSPQLVAYLALWATVLLLLGCGSGHTGPDPRSSSLVVGRRAASLPPAQLAAAANLAHRFAGAYARSIYRAVPPRLPGTSAAARRQIAAAAERVPQIRRRLRPRLAGLKLHFAAGAAVVATATVADGRSRPFTIGFSLRRLGGRWLVASVSAPE